MQQVLGGEIERMDADLQAIAALLESGERVFGQATTAEGIDGRDVHVLLGLFAKASRTLEAVTLLCKQNMGNEALGLQRALLEAVVHFRLIAERSDTEPRSARYVDFADVQRAKLVRAVQACPDLAHFAKAASGSDFQVDEVEREMKGRLGEAGYKKLKAANHWWNGNLEQACRELSVDTDYVICARLGSRALHGTDATEYVQREDVEGTTKLRLVEDETWIEAVLSSSSRLFASLLRSAYAFFGLGMEGDVERLCQEVERRHRGLPETPAGQ